MLKTNLILLYLTTQLIDPQASMASVNENITVTASTLSLSKFTNSLYILSRNDIERHGAPLLSEHLARIPGVYVYRLGGPGGQVGITMRGSGSGKTLLLLDGMPVSNQSQIGGTVSLDHIPVQNIQRVEVSRGPLGLGYGSDGLAGVINIVTIGGSHKTVAHGSVSLGTDNSHRAGTSLSFSGSQMQGIASWEGQEVLGRGDADSSNGNTEQDTYSRQAGFGRISGGWGPVSIYLIAEKNQASKDLDAVDFNLGLLMDDPNFSVQTKSEGLRAAISLHQDQWNSEVKLGNQTSDRFYQDGQDSRFPWTQESMFNGKSEFAEWNGSWDGESFSIMVGIQRKSEMGRSQANYSGSESVFDKDRSSEGIFGLISGDIGELLSFKIGVREDNYQTFGKTRNGSLETTYHLDSGQLFARAGTGFKAPSLYQTYGIVTNEDLKPEKSQGSELGYQGQLGALNIYGVLFQKTVEDEIKYISFNAGYDNDKGFLKYQGAEFNLAFNLKEGHAVKASSTLTKIVGGEAVHRFRQPKTSIGVGYDLSYKSHIVQLHAQHFDSRKDSQGRLPAFVNLEGSYNLRLSDRWKLFFRGTNLLNQYILSAKSYNPDPRVMYGGVRWTL